MKRTFLIFVTLTLASAFDIYAGSATWILNPTSGDWNSPMNWMPNTVPNGSTDTATFDLSNTTAVFVTQATEVNSIAFNAGASAFTITTRAEQSLTLSGVGIANNSGAIQNFVSDVDEAGGWGTLSFTGSATAGSGTHFTISGATALSIGAIVQFSGTASAGNSTIVNNGGTTAGSGGGILLFLDSSSADNSIIINDSASVTGGFVTEGGQMEFDGSATAADSMVTNNGGANSSQSGGLLQFRGSSSAGNAVLIANGGSNGGGGGAIWMLDDTEAASARVQVFGNGSCDVGAHSAPGLTLGSIEGSGALFLGGKNLTLGSNNLSTIFSGIIQNGGINNGTDGSLTKVGTGVLILSGPNTYHGPTTLNAGTLLVDNTSGSGTGPGVVLVNAGTLGGRGTIAGRVAIGTGSGAGAFLAPSADKKTPATLTIQSAVTFRADATYSYKVNTRRATADKVIANGVMIESGAQFNFQLVGNQPLSAGQAFSAIDNTSGNPIAGTFANLADGSTTTIGNNTFQASYEGGDGNDLTLTVVP